MVISDGTWIFKGWTPDKHENVTKNVEFVGIWEFKKNASITNHIPNICHNFIDLKTSLSYHAKSNSPQEILNYFTENIYSGGSW